MDYRQLQPFLAAAVRLNLSHATEAMSITQPGLSKSMHRLQRELGTKLYHRRGRGIEFGFQLAQGRGKTCKITTTDGGTAPNW
jgi:hypothetical protein